MRCCNQINSVECCNKLVSEDSDYEILANGVLLCESCVGKLLTLSIPPSEQSDGKAARPSRKATMKSAYCGSLSTFATRKL